MRYASLLRAGLFGSAISAFVALAAVSTAAQELTTVRLGSSVKSIFSLPLYVADQKGFFKEEGVKVAIEFFNGGPPATAALLGGSVDLIVSGFENQLKVVKRGQKVVSLATVQTSFSGSLVLRKDVADKLGRKPTVQDVKGLKIGTSSRGGVADSAARYLLASNGISPEKDVEMVPLRGFDKHIAAGEAGEINASLMIEPWQTIAVDGTKDWVYVQNFSVGEGPDLFQNMAYVTLQTTPDYLAKNRAVAEKVVRAVIRAQSFIAKERNLDELTRIAKNVFTDTDANILRISIQHQLDTYNPEISPAAIEKNITLVKIAGQFDGTAPEYDAIVDGSFKKFWSAYSAK